jgi:hypothetical protein
MHRIGNQRERVGQKPEKQLGHHKTHIESSADGKAFIEIFGNMVMMPVPMVMPAMTVMVVVVRMVAVRMITMAMHAASIMKAVARRKCKKTLPEGIKNGFHETFNRLFML